MNRSLSPSPLMSRIEPLEARIAPARVIQVGGPDFPNKADFNYSDFVDPKGLPLFVNTETAGATGDLISLAVGGGVPGAADTFYLRLAAGDKLKLFQSANSFIDFLTVTSGNVVAFFVDQQADRPGLQYSYNSGTGQAVFTYANGFAVGSTVRLDPTSGNLASLAYANYTVVAATPTSFTVAIAGAFTTGTGLATVFDRDNEVQATELVSLSLGRNVGLELLSGIQGDILTNLNEQGTRSLSDDTLEMNDLVSPAQNIGSLFVGGGKVTGKILSGGNITNVKINDGMNSILAGSAALGETFNMFAGLVPGGGGTLTGKSTNSAVVPAAGVVGASMANITISNISFNTSIDDRIEAGRGGAGARGGSLTNMFITDDTDGFRMIAGNGGDGDSVRKNGGAGGVLSQVFVGGRDDQTPNSRVGLRAGDGGSSTTGGNGGVGGALSGVFVGFQLIGGRAVQSVDPLEDNIEIQAGLGGAGRVGGAGGGISSVNAIVSAANGLGDEIAVVAGRGGNSNLLSGGVPGVGGSVIGVTLRNLSDTTSVPVIPPPVLPGIGAKIRVQAGDGGTAVGLGSSAAGGSVRTATLLGADLEVLAGNGSDGKTGGAGGSVIGITVSDSETVIAHNLNIRAGRGGNGGQGSGGRGGGVDVVTVANGDFTQVEINPGGGGDGGIGTGGAGGAGGSVGRLSVTDIDSSAATVFEGTARIRAGHGGAGSLGGGAGGAIVSGTLELVDMNILVASGNGGSVLPGGRGNGGAAGYVRIVASTDETVGLNDVTVTVLAGTGGSAQPGTSGSGGAGGVLNRVVGISQGTVSLTAGSGGDGGTGAAGSGGSVVSSVAFSENNDAFIFAGNGGALGARPGVGGDILGTAGDQSPGAYGADDVSLIAGNGTHGGRGGSIKLVGFGSTIISGLVAPAGDVTVRAGNGSVEGRFAGAGGSIASVNGSVSTGAGKFTRILGGDGGGGPTAVAAGAGGSIASVSLILGGGAGSEVRVEAGDAGAGGSSLATGAAGGSVVSLQIANLNPATVIRHIAAGEGGAAGRRGGTGGSISDVTVPGEDIGVRSFSAFGFTSMGGLFAGAGGTASVSGAAGKGLPGNVVNVRAAAIAAIVAGKGAIPEAVGTVDRIYLGPATDLLKASEGDLNFSDGGLAGWHSFLNARYQTAGLVGAVVNPFVVDANKFKLAVGGDVNGNGLFELGDTPLDGLIIARVFKQQNTNFTPEARLVGSVFYDYDNLT